MAVNTLSELNPGSRDWTVQVYVSRLWQHRGATDDGPIKHTDIVFQDKKANHMYGEIATGLVNQFIDRIEEGRVYELKRFLVGRTKNCYRPVEGQFIIKFGRYTTVRRIDDVLMDYPLCTYVLTPIDDLPSPSDMPGTFTDVVGIFTGVSPISQYHSASRATPSTKRVVYLSDLSGHQISVVLWGERAIAFEADRVLRTARTAAVVIVFVGTLVKPFEGRRILSGGAPCRWYINEDLPEITHMLTQLNGRIPAVENIVLPGQSAAEISAQVDLDSKTVEELLKLNIWNHQKTKFYCTLTLTKLSPGERWWFSACTICNKSTVPFGSQYKCPDANCGGTAAAPRYRICFVGSDGTGEVDLLFFDKAGKELVGRSALALLRSKAPQGVSQEEAVQFGRTDQSVPRELASVVSRKYRLVVSVTSKSFEPEMDEPAYQVHRLDVEYGKQPRSSAVVRGPDFARASSSSSAGEGSGLAFVSSAGLNSIGLAMAEDAAVDHDNSSSAPAGFDSSAVGVGLSTASASAMVATSVVGSEAPILDTPPSVSKPVEPSDGKSVSAPKSVGESSVKKALFQEKSPAAALDDVLGSGSQVEVEEPVESVLADESVPPGSIAGAVPDKTTERHSRQPTAKTQQDTQLQAKKRKT